MGRVAQVPDPSLDTRPLPTPYAQPFATPQGQGAGFGDVLQGAAHVASQFEQDAKQDADIARRQGAIAKSNAALNDQILDPEKGYYSLRGEDAMSGRQKALDTFGKTVDDIQKTLTPDQQRMFADHAQSVRDQAFRHVVSHENEEIGHLKDAQFKGSFDESVKLLQNPAILRDPEQIKEQMSSVLQGKIFEAQSRFGKNASRDVLASVALPAAQAAAYAGMEAAVAQSEQTGDPTIASGAFGVLGKHLVTSHQSHFAGVVQRLAQQKEIKDTATSVIGPSSVSVPVPGGLPVARLDATRVAARLAALPLDSPLLPEVQKAVEQRQGILDKGWNDTVAKVVSDSLTEGTNPTTGEFNLSKVSTAHRVWLQQNAAGKLIELRALADRGDARTRRGQSLEDKLTSAENYNTELAQMIDPTLRASVYGPMTMEQFGTRLNAYERVGGLVPQHRTSLLTEFKRIKTEAAKPSETVGLVVNEVLRDAFKDNPKSKKVKDYVGPLKDEADTWVQQEKAKHAGQAPDPEAIRDFVSKRLLKVPGTAPHFWSSDLTQIDLDIAAKAAQTAPAGAPAAQVPVVRAAPVAPAPLYRYSADRKRRVPVNAAGVTIGPIEVVQ